MNTFRSTAGALRRAIAAGLLLALAAAAQAQLGPPPEVVMKGVPAPPEPDAIPLRPDTGPVAPEQWTTLWGQLFVRNVQRAVLLPVKPAQPNGRAVLVVPGGGYTMVSITAEGQAVAERLASKGYTAYILKYRVRPTPPAPEDYQRQFATEMQSMGRTPRDQRPPVPPYGPAVEDAQLAMLTVRRLAAEAGLQADRIGYLGFSAGARTGVALVAAARPGTLPHTLGVIYGPLNAPAVAAPLPALFVVHAIDDPLIGMGDFGLVQTWLKTGQRTEMHLYERGGHGFALHRTGATSEGWIDAYLAWMERQQP